MRAFLSANIRLRQLPFELSSSRHISIVHSRPLSTEVGAVSKRRQFQQTQVDTRILDYIRRVGVGIPERRGKRNRKTVPVCAPKGRRGSQDTARIALAGSNASWKPPPPFGFKRSSVSLVGELATITDTPPIASKEFVPEVALAGRSNVGKSTLLNALLYGNRSSVERTRVRGRTPDTMKLPKGAKAIMSNRPGETRKVTFYQLQSRNVVNEEQPYEYQLRLVDLPGYGFAHASAKAAATYQSLIANYLLYRGKPLRRMLLLLDARHGFKTADVRFLQDLQKACLLTPEHGGRSSSTSNRLAMMPPIQVVLTKCDLVSQSDLVRRVIQARQALADALVRERSRLPILCVSARAGVGYNNVIDQQARGGILELQKELAALVVPRCREMPKPKQT